MVDRTYTPKEKDELEQEFYPSGQLKQSCYTVGGQPSNGWTVRNYYEHGALQREQSFSHGLLIEQVEYDTEGNITSHQIYSHNEKEVS